MKKYPGSDINNFRKVVHISKNLLEKTNTKNFFSPYSVVPIISQIVGLSTPLLGSGASPYSIISIISRISSELSLFKEIYLLAPQEKRKIIDEIYDMIVPILLGEEKDYVEFLINVRYFQELKKYSEKKKHEFKKILEEKFSVLVPFILQFHKGKGDFAHIAHYGYLEDLYRECSFLRYFPRELIKKWFNYSYPIVNEIIIKNFNPSNSRIKKEIRGWIIFVANSTQQLLRENKLGEKKILQSALLAKKLGARVIAMGGLIASFAKGGYFLSERIKNVGFTTGHAYTIANIMKIIDKCGKRINLNIKKNIIAIVGAAGSIGSGCAKLLAEKGVCRIVLVDTTSLVSYKKLKNLEEELKRINSDIKVSSSTALLDIKKADLVIIATNSPFSLVKAEHLKPGAVVIDDSFPKNVSEKILEKRDDIILLEGGAVQLPLSVDIQVARSMPDLMDAPLIRLISCKEVYGCFAELLILALMNYKRNYGLGPADPKLAKDITGKAEMVGISSASLQCFDKAVEEKRFKRNYQVRKLLKEQINIR